MVHETTGDDMKKTAYGYDGNGYSVGDRVELSPACDLWMQGARYGDVTSLVWNMVHVRLDKLPGKILRTACDLVRRID